MSARRETSLVLRLREVGESDLMLDLYTLGLGRATAQAKGGKRSRRRFTGQLLAGQLLEAELAPTKSPSLWRLESSRLLEPHVGLRLEWRRWLAAAPVLELLLRATAPHDPSAPSLELALAALGRMAREHPPQRLASALVVFLVRLLALQGYALSLDACVHCGRAAGDMPRPSLSSAGGLSCCAAPGQAWALDAPLGLIKGLAAAGNLSQGQWERLTFPPALLPPALEFLHRLWRDISGHDLPATQLARGLTKPRA